MMKNNFSSNMQLSVKESYDQCTGCNRCMKQCPMLSSYCDSPKNILATMHKEKRIEKTIPYSCNLCGHCTFVCKQDVDLKALFLKARQEITNNGEFLSISSKTVVKFHQMNSFSDIFSTGVVGEGKTFNTVFFPGCSLVSTKPNMVLEIFEDLKTIYPSIGIMLNCCGNPTHVMGEKRQFSIYNNKLIKLLEEAEEIIVACPNCFNMLSESCDKKIKTLWEVFLEKDMLDKKDICIDWSYSIHDPCPTREHKAVHESIRSIITSLGIRTVEMSHSRENTLCCGSGGMVGVTNQAIASKQMQRRASQSSEDRIITYCQECVESLRKGGKEAYHILDFIYDEHLSLDNITMLRKWMNRFEAKRMVMKREIK